MNKLITFLNDNKIPYNDSDIAKFDIYFNLLIEWNNKFNLTAITDRYEVVTKHFIDSLMGYKYIVGTDNIIIDIGAGAGFPSVPLAIVMPNNTFVMVDSLGKRVKFLDELISALGLTNVTAHHDRAEDFIKDKREKFDYAIARAVAPLPILIEYLAPYVKIKGKLIAYKGDNFAEELAQSSYAFGQLGCSLDRVELRQLDDQYSRNFIIINKFTNSKFIYPRGGNKPRLFPLIK